MTRKLVFAASLMIIVVGMLGVASDLHVGYASPYTDVDVDTAYNMITNGSYPDLVVFDVRTQSEYDSGHIYGAVWIPQTELEARISELAGHEDHEVIVYCLSGGRSATASGILDSNSFTKVYNMLGGFSAWQSSGYQVWIATVHNLNTTINYDTIQAAIDAPETSDGHTILVDNGTYYEHVVVDKAVSLIGENKHTTIIDGSGKTVVSLTVNNTKIKGFTVQDGPNGILMFPWTHGHTISSNIVLNNEYGIAGHYDCASVIICDNIITLNNITGIEMLFSHSVISNNLISDNGRGEFQEYSSGIQIVKGVNSKVVYCVNNTIFGNTIKNHRVGIWAIQYSEENIFFHNNFINNTRQVDGTMSNDTWDHSYPSGGNYWSDYKGEDYDNDGIGDTPYTIYEYDQDNHPLMGKFYDFDATSEHHVQTISNSSISTFRFNGTAICFDVAAVNGSIGFCRMCIPRSLMNETYRVFVNGTEILPAPLPLPCSNNTHTYLYFTYNHSTQEVIIIPEFPSFLILPVFMLATLLAVIVYKRKHKLGIKREEFSFVVSFYELPRMFVNSK